VKTYYWPWVLPQQATSQSFLFTRHPERKENSKKKKILVKASLGAQKHSRVIHHSNIQ